MPKITNDANGHPYCDHHFEKEALMNRAVEDIKKTETEMKESVRNLHERIDAVACRSRESVDGSDKANSKKNADIYKLMRDSEDAHVQKNADIYEVIRELEKNKMTNKTFWAVMTIVICLLGIVMTIQNTQINNTRKDQIRLSNEHTTMMEGFSYKLGGKLDVLQDDVRDLRAGLKLVENEVSHISEEVKEHKAYHKKPWEQ